MVDARANRQGGSGCQPGAFTAFSRLVGSERAAISPLTALMLIPLAGSIAFAAELGGWYYVQRSMQNAADTAALAAASNNNQSGIGTSPQTEARAAARPFGYIDGQNNVTVTAGTTTCPTGTATGSTCYEAIISSVFPVSFSGVLGFMGTEALGSGRGQRVTARAVATAAGGGGSEDVCVWTLSSATNSFTSNGGPRPDMAGCTLLSNGGMTCNGHDLGADYGVALGVSTGCGAHQISNASPITDPYDARKSNIPSNALSSCAGSFPQMFKNKGKWTVASSNQISGSSLPWAGTQKIFCGDVQLSGDVTLSGTTTLIIENGRLDLNGHTLRTADGAAATIVFSGDNTTTYSHYPSSLNGGGTLIIEAPDKDSTSPWKGIAIYQDPAVSANTSFTYSGNDPTWNITGLVYLPHSNVTFSGVVNKASDGASCFVLVSYSMLVNGTAQIFANTQCDAAGLGTPSVTVGSSTREKLVL
ncbi:MAG TPA: pilus assembly protein TadG-related protein [Novosphingobium sp.]